MNTQRVDSESWPHILADLHRFGATPGELCRVSDMIDCGLHEVALSLVDSVLERLRTERKLV